VGALLTYSALLASTALAQPTNNVLSRVTMVEFNRERGTIFSLDVNQREYWVTAKHILTGAKHPPYGSISSKTVSLRVLDPSAVQGERWFPIEFSVFDPGKDIDIVVLVAQKPLLSNPPPSEPTDSSGLFLGGDCEFLGFPYGRGWRVSLDNSSRAFWLPYVKHCTVSMLATAEPRIWILDGINNEGFSGGPVIFRTGSDQKIFAVISGYVLEPTDVFLSTAPAKKKMPVGKSTEKQRVNLNSGFIVAYDINYAIDAINKNPIGPLRSSK
jgi:hypothetical protein